jgi:hypothetical protein
MIIARSNARLKQDQKNDFAQKDRQETEPLWCGVTAKGCTTLATEGRHFRMRELEWSRLQPSYKSTFAARHPARLVPLHTCSSVLLLCSPVLAANYKHAFRQHLL